MSIRLEDRIFTLTLDLKYLELLKLLRGASPQVCLSRPYRWIINSKKNYTIQNKVTIKNDPVGPAYVGGISILRP